MNNEWIEIHSGINYIKIEMMKQLLNNNNINAIILNQMDSSYLLFGRIKLFTKKINQEEALKLISIFEDENKN